MEFEINNSTLEPSPTKHRYSRATLIFHLSDAPGYRPIVMSIVVLICLLSILIWNWRRHKISKDSKLGFIQSENPFFTDTILLLWGLGSGYGIIFAMKSPFYELIPITNDIVIIFKGVGSILLGFLIGFIHVYYESENDYSTVRRSLTQKMKHITSVLPHVKILQCNFKDIFLIFWSLFSGYGIIFAIESWMYELFGLKTQIAYIIKPCVAIVAGFGIGIVHFYYDILQSRFVEGRPRAYAQVNSSKVSEHKNGLDMESHLDETESDLDEEYSLQMEMNHQFLESSKLERTSTIEELAEINDAIRLKLNRSKTYVANTAYENLCEKRTERLNTM